MTPWSNLHITQTLLSSLHCIVVNILISLRTKSYIIPEYDIILNFVEINTQNKLWGGTRYFNFFTMFSFQIECIAEGLVILVLRKYLWETKCQSKFGSLACLHNVSSHQFCKLLYDNAKNCQSTRYLFITWYFVFSITKQNA